MAQTFTKVEDISTLIPVLEERWPISCFMLNQLHCQEKYGKDLMEIYVHGSCIREVDTWILTKFLREDWSEFISISAPSQPTIGNIDEIKNIFRTSDLINWSVQLVFTALDINVTNMITSLHAEAEEQIQPITTIPSCLYSMSSDDALKLDTNFQDDTIRVGPLEMEEGTVFITDNWVHHKDTSYSIIRKCIHRLISGGIFLKEGDGTEKLVCGAVTLPLGLLSMLHTDPEHRRKGYASLCEKYLLKEYARNGLHPCLV